MTMPSFKAKCFEVCFEVCFTLMQAAVLFGEVKGSMADWFAALRRVERFTAKGKAERDCERALTMNLNVAIRARLGVCTSELKCLFFEREDVTLDQMRSDAVARKTTVAFYANNNYFQPHLMNESALSIAST